MTNQINTAKASSFEIRKSKLDFVVISADRGEIGRFRTEARARDLIDMLTNPDWAE